MGNVLLIVVGLALLLSPLIAWILWLKLSSQLGRMKTELGEQVSTGSVRMQEQVQESLRVGREEQRDVLQKTVHALEQKLGGLQERVDQKLSQTVAANRQDLARVTDRLAKLHEATGQIVALSKGVNELHTLMKTPNWRGSFGEWTLERMLEEVLGQEGQIFRRQFTLSRGERADAAIFTRPGGDQVVCVDSKFPATQAQSLLSEGVAEEQRATVLRQFCKDVQSHAKDIAEKYICPPETLSFAFMFVPSESIFQLILQQRDLHEKLLRMNVIPTAPNSFYAYLQALAFALRGLKIQESAIEIQKQVGYIARDFERFAKNYGTLGSHLEKASSKYDETLRDIKRFQDRVSQIQSIQQEDAALPADKEQLPEPNGLLEGPPLEIDEQTVSSSGRVSDS